MPPDANPVGINVSLPAQVLSRFHLISQFIFAQVGISSFLESRSPAAGTAVIHADHDQAPGGQQLKPQVIASPPLV